MSPSEYVPQQGWDALLQRSLTRGHALRRRRHVLLVLPVVVAVAVTGLGMSFASQTRGTAPSRLDVVDHRPSPLPQPSELLLLPSRERGDASLPEATASPTGSPPARPVVTDVPVPTSSLPSGLPAFASPELSYDDPVGDAAPGGVGPQAQAASAPAGDIVRMRFEALPDRLRITMTLAAPADSTYQYGGWVTDPVSDCQLQIHLGPRTGGGYYMACGGSYVGGWVPAPDTVVRGTTMTATLPWKDFPARVDPTHDMTTEGHAYITNAAQPVPTDVARSARHLSRSRVT